MTPLSTGQRGVSDVEAAGALLARQRRTFHERLLAGASGAEIVSAFAEFVDALVIGRYRNAVRTADEKISVAGLQHCCLVALGGYGRRELAPYSDVDLMFLYRPDAKDAVSMLDRKSTRLNSSHVEIS